MDLGKLHINQDAIFGVNCIDKSANATRYELLVNPGPDKELISEDIPDSTDLGRSKPNNLHI